MITVASDISDAYDAGRWHFQPFYKVLPSTFSTAGAWFDCTVAGTHPRGSYYAGDDYVFTLYPSANHLRHFAGPDVSPYQKIVKSILIRGSAAGLAPSYWMLCDFIGFYQGISWETTDEQVLDNTITLPRYTDGTGVKAFFVQLIGSNTSSISTMNYVNQAGEAKTSQTIRGNALATGAIQNSTVAATYQPFVDLAAGDIGVRSVTSVTVTTLGSGVAVLVLVKPLCLIPIRDATLVTPYERDFVMDMSRLPIVTDGACLNFLMAPSATASGLIAIGGIEYIWG